MTGSFQEIYLPKKEPSIKELIEETNDHLLFFMLLDRSADLLRAIFDIDIDIEKQFKEYESAVRSPLSYAPVFSGATMGYWPVVYPSVKEQITKLKKLKNVRRTSSRRTKKRTAGRNRAKRS